MSRNDAPKDNGYRLKKKCFSCGWIGTTNHVCPSCGSYYELMSTVVVKWVSTIRWYHFFFYEMGNKGYWKELK